VLIGSSDEVESWFGSREIFDVPRVCRRGVDNFYNSIKNFGQMSKELHNFAIDHEWVSARGRERGFFGEERQKSFPASSHNIGDDE
jgi:hypothetical protein